MIIRFIAGVGFAVSLALLAADTEARGAEPSWSQKVAPFASADEAIADWPGRAKAAARSVISMYGRPDEIGKYSLVWNGNGPWKKTVVHREAWPHYAFIRDKDFLENAIRYVVPDAKIEELARFDKRLQVDRSSAELSARSESESTNYLALNLADEIVRGKRTVGEAMELREKLERLASAGKSSPYLNGFLFEVRNDPPIKRRYNE